MIIRTNGIAERLAGRALPPAAPKTCEEFIGTALDTSCLHAHSLQLRDEFSHPGPLMSNFQPVNAKSYYDYLPSYDNSCGDIWLNMPTFGLLNSDKVPGIVVSPACDVSNFKTETITYLPIIPVRSYFSTIGFIPIIRREIAERLRSAGFQSNLHWPEPGYLTPGRSEIDKELELIEECLKSASPTKAQRDHLPRAAAGLRIAKACERKEEASLEDVAKLYGSNWQSVKRQLISNAFRTDVHFLPKDIHREDESYLRSHCLVLFRYPMTMQAELLAAAQSHRADQWPAFVERHVGDSLLARQISGKPPLKCLSLKASFLADMLSRFTALYSRIGSPDFSKMQMDKYALELDHG